MLPNPEKAQVASFSLSMIFLPPLREVVGAMALAPLREVVCRVFGVRRLTRERTSTNIFVELVTVTIACSQ